MAAVQLAREVAHQLAEVHAVLRREVAHDLAAAKQVLHAHGLHVEPGLVREPAERGERLVPTLRQHVRAREVLVGRDAHHGLQPAGLAYHLAQALRGDLLRVHGRKANLLAALRGADDVVALLGAGLSRIEPQVVGRIFELHR